MKMGVIELPSELWLHIMSYMNVEESMLLRYMTSAFFHRYLQEKYHTIAVLTREGRGNRFGQTPEMLAARLP